MLIDLVWLTFERRNHGDARLAESVWLLQLWRVELTISWGTNPSPENNLYNVCWAPRLFPSLLRSWHLHNVNKYDVPFMQVHKLMENVVPKQFSLYHLLKAHIYTNNFIIMHIAKIWFGGRAYFWVIDDQTCLWMEGGYICRVLCSNVTWSLSITQMISCKVNIKYTLVFGSNNLLHDQELQVDKIGLEVTRCTIQLNFCW